MKEISEELKKAKLEIEKLQNLRKVYEELHEALIISEKRYQSVVNNVKEVIFQTDATGL